GFATDTFDGLGSHSVNCDAEDAAPEVDSTFPVDNATDFPIGENLQVNFTEAVNTNGNWFDLSCSVSGSNLTANIIGGPQSFTIDPDLTLVSGETCTLTIFASQITDADENDPPDNMILDFIVDFS